VAPVCRDVSWFVPHDEKQTVRRRVGRRYYHRFLPYCVVWTEERCGSELGCRGVGLPGRYDYETVDLDAANAMMNHLRQGPLPIGKRRLKLSPSPHANLTAIRSLVPPRQSYLISVMTGGSETLPLPAKLTIPRLW
jgi:hypothetical protein